MCRHWNMQRPDIGILNYANTGQQVNGALQNSRILRNTDLHWCFSITSTITLQYLGTSFQHFVCMCIWLHVHVFLPVSSAFFQFFFFPLSSGRNWISSFFHSSRKEPISSGRFWTLFWTKAKKMRINLQKFLQHWSYCTVLCIFVVNSHDLFLLNGLSNSYQFGQITSADTVLNLVWVYRIWYIRLHIALNRCHSNWQITVKYQILMQVLTSFYNVEISWE